MACWNQDELVNNEINETMSKRRRDNQIIDEIRTNPIPQNWIQFNSKKKNRKTFEKGIRNREKAYKSDDADEAIKSSKGEEDTILP